MLKEFREFAMKGNVMDLAIGVIIGAAFSKIVDSLVKDIIMPLIGMFGSADFSNYFIPLSKAVTATNLADAQKQGAVLAYGSFLTYTVNFLIVAFALFLVVRGINAMKRRAEAAQPPAAPAPTPREVLLLEEIRDILARKPVV
jgi:large conductance mechanosensitive channel